MSDADGASSSRTVGGVGRFIIFIDEIGHSRGSSSIQGTGVVFGIRILWDMGHPRERELCICDLTFEAESMKVFKHTK